MAGKRYTAKQTFSINVDGEQMTVGAGEVLNTANKTGGAIIKQLGAKGREEHLDEFAGFGRFDTEDSKVEQATHAPGEKR